MIYTIERLETHPTGAIYRNGTDPAVVGSTEIGAGEVNIGVPDMLGLTLENVRQIATAIFESGGGATQEAIQAMIDASVSSGKAPYVHLQPVGASIWTIVHNLGHYPDLTIYDDQNEQIIGDVRHDSLNVSTITFTVPVSGIARAD